MRDHQPDPADDAGDRDHARRDQRGADDDDEPEPARLDPERARLLVAERQHVDPPAQQHQRHQPGENRRRGGQDVLGLHPGQAAEQPEGDRRQLVVGIGQHLEERGRRAGQRADHHAGQHQDQRAVADADRSRDESDKRHRGEPAGEAHQLDRQHRERQEDAEHRAQPGARRDAEDVGRDQRVAEQRLVARAGGGERRADQQRGRHPGQADREQHGLRLPPAPAAAEDPERLAEPERVRPDQQRAEGARDQRGKQDDGRSGRTRSHRRRLPVIASPPSPPPIGHYSQRHHARNRSTAVRFNFRGLAVRPWYQRVSGGSLDPGHALRHASTRRPCPDCHPGLVPGSREAGRERCRCPGPRHKAGVTRGGTETLPPFGAEAPND